MLLGTDDLGDPWLTMAGLQIKHDFLIIGGGIAGVSCAEMLGFLTRESKLKIAIISASSLVKAAVNVQKLGHVMESMEVEEQSSSFLTQRFPNITVITGFVVGIDTNIKFVEFIDGNGDPKRLGYSKLCITTGATPRKFFASDPCILSIRDTESVQDFKKKLSNAKRIAVIGNGGIATELVYEVKSCHVIWCIKHKNISAAFFDESAAQFFLPHLHESSESSNKMSKRWKYTTQPQATTYSQAMREGVDGSHGNALGPDWAYSVELKGSAFTTSINKVTVEYSVEVEQICTDTGAKHCQHLQEHVSDSDYHNWPVHIHLSNGRIYGVDLVINATGVVPSLHLKVDGNQITTSDTDGGIITDTEMRSNVSDVYAAGDIVYAGHWDHSKLWHQMRLWTQAKQMGCYAAKCMYSHHKGDSVTMDFCFELFNHVTEFFGFRVVLLGLYNAQGLSTDEYSVQIRCTQGMEYIKLVISDHKVIGAVLIGDTDMEETIENLILNQLDISHIEEHLLEPGVDIDDYFD